MCPIEEIRYHSSAMNFEKYKKIVDSFGEGINKIRLVIVVIGEILVDARLNRKIDYLKSKLI